MELCPAGFWSEGPLLVSTLVCYWSEEPPFLGVLVTLSQYLLLPGLVGSADFVGAGHPHIPVHLLASMAVDYGLV